MAGEPCGSKPSMLPVNTLGITTPFCRGWSENFSEEEPALTERIVIRFPLMPNYVDLAEIVVRGQYANDAHTIRLAMRKLL